MARSRCQRFPCELVCRHCGGATEIAQHVRLALEHAQQVHADPAAAIEPHIDDEAVIAGGLIGQLAFEAIECGYDEGLLLDDQGYVAEASGASFFMVVDGKLVTPPSDNALVSITQKTVIEVAQDMGIEVERRRISREEVYIADEAFLTGTAAEITPVRIVDAREIGCGSRGNITEKIHSTYFDIVFGRNKQYEHYLTYID